MYNNNILIFQESPTILNAYTKKSGNLSYAPRIILFALNRNLPSHPKAFKSGYSERGQRVEEIKGNPVVPIAKDFEHIQNTPNAVDKER